MDLIEELRLCDVVFLGVISYHDADGTWTKNPQAFAPKKVGELAFELDLEKHLGIKGAKENILLQGAPNGLLGSDPVVRWSVDQSVKFEVSPGIEVDAHVTGQIDTVLVRQARAPMNASPDPATTFGVRLEGTGVDSDALKASALGQERKYDRIDIQAAGGRVFIPPVLGVGMDQDRDECGIGALPGGSENFFARVSGADPSELKLTWSVSGDATVAGPTDHWLFRVKLGTSGAPYQVTLQASTAEVSATTTRIFQPESVQSVALKGFLCKLRRDVVRNVFVDPLWDPLRDRPSVDPREQVIRVAQVIGLAQRMRRYADDLLRGIAAAPSPTRSLLDVASVGKRLNMR